MRKSTFIVSNYRKLWIDNTKNLFIIEPYVYHMLEKNNEINNFSNIKVAPYRHKTKIDIIEDSRYVDEKYAKYVEIIAERLNHINGVNYSKFFWKKSLSMAFIRYITAFYDIFKKCEIYFNADEYECNILSEKSYYTPFDFEDHRVCFQNNDFGFEQIFSIYVNLFYPGIFKEINIYKQEIDAISEHDGLKTGINIDKTAIKNLIRLIYRNTFEKSIKNKKAPIIQIGILGSFFSKENLNTLIKKSSSRIYPLDWQININHKKKEMFWDKRSYLSEHRDDFDKFDKFFFTSLKYCLPKVFVEKFVDVENLYKRKMRKYKCLKYAISEAWISNTYMSICLALLQEMGIKHITNEHNALMFPYAGSYITHVASLSDIFVSLGWDDPRISNLIKGASLFPFDVKKKCEKKYKILYISCDSLVKMAHYISHYGTDGENSHKYLEFVKSFFKNLSPDTLNELAYRAYPKPYVKFLSYDKEFILSSYLKKVKSFTNTRESGKIQMRKADMIIIDYVSTSHLEAMKMNIPVVFFWNPCAYYLKNEYSDFFKPLIDVGICQTDPVKAAQFIESIKDNPEKWWFSGETQKRKNEFLNKNVGKPEIMINYLLSFLN